MYGWVTWVTSLSGSPAVMFGLLIITDALVSVVKICGFSPILSILTVITFLADMLNVY
jgi:hypothetical protein